MQKNVINSYPAATGPYKLRILGKSTWQGCATARLQISVGQPKHEKEKFFALTEWAAARFDKVQLIVSDTLQRHNIAMEKGISLREAYDVSAIVGQMWLRDNRAAIARIPAAKLVVTMWDDWMHHPDYAPMAAAVNSLFETSESFKLAVEDKAREFCARRIAYGQTMYGADAAYQASVKYLMEELPAFGVMLKQESAVDIYPGAWMKDIFGAIAATGDEKLAVYGDANYLHVDYVTNHALTARPAQALRLNV